MPATEAQIAANRRNAELSRGPITSAGKERSRANSFKHGLTGAGVVMAEADAAEVERLSGAFARELDAPGEAGETLARRLAMFSVRLDRCADQQTAHLTERVQNAIDEFEPPEGASPEEAEKLRTLAARRAMFDPSNEAHRARQYEAAAERGFFRTLKEIRQLKADHDGPAKAAAEEAARLRKALAGLGSFSNAPKPAPEAPPQPAPEPSKPTPSPAKPAPIPPVPPLDLSPTGWDPFPSNVIDVPIAIRRPR